MFELRLDVFVVNDDETGCTSGEDEEESVKDGLADHASDALDEFDLNACFDDEGVDHASVGDELFLAEFAKEPNEEEAAGLEERGVMVVDFFLIAGKACPQGSS